MSGAAKSESLVTVGVRLTEGTVRLLDELAAESGLKRAGMVAALIEELAPKLERITPRRGVQIELKRQAAESAGASPPGRSVAGLRASA